jgi:hypothetical protein
MNSDVVEFYAGLKTDLDSRVMKSPKMKGTVDYLLTSTFFNVDSASNTITINFRNFKHEHYIKLFGGPYEVQEIIQMLLSLELQSLLETVYATVSHI